MTLNARIALRRTFGFGAVALLLTADIVATGLFGGSERTLALVRSIVLPGLPFLEWSVPIGVATMAVALASIGAWLRWGIDWLPVTLMLICAGVAAFVIPLHHDSDDPPAHHDRLSHSPGSRVHAIAEPRAGVDDAFTVESSHEFTLVLVVFAMLARLRLMFDRLPGAAWIRSALPSGWFFPARDIALSAAFAELASPGSQSCSPELRDERLRRRACRVNAWSRLRFRGDPFTGAHAPVRAALALTGSLDPPQVESLRHEARAQLAGVPASEPTWVRPLDGMLVALALQDLGEEACVSRWRATFAARFALRHGRRAAALHTPSMLSIGTAPAWEHASATALGRRAGWLGDEDWQHLRPHCLGRAASGARDAETLRLVAAGKVWATLVGDVDAMAILDRRSIAGDRVAVALAGMAQGLAPRK